MTVMKVQEATMSTETEEYLTGKLVVTLNYAISIILYNLVTMKTLTRKLVTN